VLSTAFACPGWTPGIALHLTQAGSDYCGLCIGLLAFTRPLTAVGVAIPFVPHAAILLWRGDWRGRRRMLAFGLVALVMARCSLSGNGL